jgi:thiosulfate reductase cytochrome b subunit
LLVAVGVITLAEGPCLFFLVVALWAFARMVDPSEPWDWRTTIVFAASISASMGLRYEIWMYLPMWPLVLWRRRGFARAAAVGAMIGAFPLLHMIVTWRITGNPINFVAVSAATTSLNAAVTPWDERAMLWFQALGKIEGWPLFAAGVVGVVYALVSGRGRLIAGMYVYYLAVVEAQALRAAMAPELHRYATFLVALSLPSIATLLWGLAKRVFPSHASARAVAIAAGLLLSMSSLFYFAHIRQEATYFLESFEVADRLKTLLRDDDRVLMGKESHPLIVVESGKAWRNFRVLQYLHGEAADRETTERVFREWRPNYVLATRHDPSFPATVPVNFCARSELFGAAFAPAFEYGPWCLLRREDAPEPAASAQGPTS